MKKLTNKILEDHGNWLLIDISTPRYPDATMAVDTDDFNSYGGGRIRAVLRYGNKYISAFFYNGSKEIPFHKFVINPDKNMEVDHIIHGTMNFIDNRRSNIRSVTRIQNMMNKSVYKNNKSGINGVSWQDGFWRVRISINGKKKSLGCFDNIEIAIGVRRQAEIELYGEYAYKGNEF